MDLERSIISGLLADPDEFKKILSLRKELFVLYQKEFQYLRSIRAKHGVAPDLDIFTQHFPDFQIEKNLSAPVQFYIDELQGFSLKNAVKEAIDLGMKSINTDPYKAKDDIISVLKKAGLISSSLGIIQVPENIDERILAYEAAQNIQGYIGVPTGFREIDKQTRGLADGTYNVFFGRPGSYKTWILVYAACYAWSEGYQPLFITREMTKEEIVRRIDSILTKVPYSWLKDGTFPNTSDRDIFNNRLKVIEGGIPFNVIDSDGNGDYTVNFVAAQIEEFKPSAVYVDGIYLLQDAERGRNQTEQLKNISRSLQALAKDAKVPILCTTQANRSGDAQMTGAAVHGSDAFLQDADNLIAISRHVEQDPSVPSGSVKTNYVTLEPVKSRDAVIRPERYYMDFDVMELRWLNVIEGIEGGIEEVDDEIKVKVASCLAKYMDKEEVDD